VRRAADSNNGVAVWAPDGKRVAIAGYGLRNGSVAVLDRTSGDVVQALINPKGNDQVIWYLAFSPSGQQLAFGTDDGSIWLWTLNSGKADDVRRLGPAGATRTNGINRVRQVRFLDATRLLTVAQDAKVLQWDVSRPDAAPRQLWKFDLTGVYRVAMSPDHKWLAATSEGGQKGENTRVEIRGLEDGKHGPRIPPQAEGDYPHAVAFDAKSERLAFSTRRVDVQAAFYRPVDSQVLIYELAKPGKPWGSFKTRLHAESIAFHRDGQFLASAGGPDHALTLWKLDPRSLPQPLRKVAQKELHLWVHAWLADRAKKKLFRPLHPAVRRGHPLARQRPVERGLLA